MAKHTREGVKLPKLQRSVEQVPDDSVDEPISQVMEKSLEVDKIVLWERISERLCEQSGFIEVPKISRDRVLQRKVVQTLDESCVARERVQQRNAKSKSWTLCSNSKECLRITLPASSVKRGTTGVAEKEWPDLLLLLGDSLSEIKEQFALA